MNREPDRYQVKVFWPAFCFGMYFRRHHTCFYCRTVPFVLKKQLASVSARTNAKILVSHRFAGHKKNVAALTEWERMIWRERYKYGLYRNN